MKILSLDTVPADILLQVVASLGLRDAIALSMVNRSLHTLSKEHCYWLGPLRLTRLSQPLPCATVDDIAGRSAESLKQLALHAVRLRRNWRDPFPKITGPITTFRCGLHNSILYCLPGTDAIVLYSLEEGTIICADMKTGQSSTPMYVGRIIDMSSPMEEPTSFTVAALIDDRSILVFEATNHPALSTRIVFECKLHEGYDHNAIFMNSTVVGVARICDGGSMEIQTFNLRDADHSTVIITDRPQSRTSGSTVIGDTIYFIVLQFDHALVYACPQRLLAGAAPSSDMDFTIQRSHVGRIPRPDDDIPLVRRDYCVLSTEPNHGCNTISVVKVFTRSQYSPHSLEITFWPRPAPLPRTSFDSDEDHEKAEHKLMLPSQTISIPGTLSNQPETAWELLVIANSGHAVVLLVDPLPEPSSNAESADGEEVPPAALPPKLMLVRYDPLLNTASLHELRIPNNTGDGEAELGTRVICGLALDDHRGFVIVVTIHNVLHAIPYA